MKPHLPAIAVVLALSAPAAAQEATQTFGEITGLLLFDGRCQALAPQTRTGLAALRSDTLTRVPGPGVPDALQLAEVRARESSGRNCTDAATIARLRELTPAAEAAFAAWSARTAPSPSLATFRQAVAPTRPQGPRPPKPGDFYRFTVAGDQFLRDCDPGEPVALLPAEQIPAAVPPNVGAETKVFPFGGQTALGAINVRHFAGGWVYESADIPVKEAIGANIHLVKCAR